MTRLEKRRRPARSPPRSDRILRQFQPDVTSLDQTVIAFSPVSQAIPDLGNAMTLDFVKFEGHVEL